MRSKTFHRLMAPSVAIMLAISPLALAGCKKGGDVPTSEDIDKAAKEEQGGADGVAQGGGGGGSGAPQDTGGGSSETVYDAEGNPVSGGSSTRTSANGQYSTNDFIEGSAIYNKATAEVTNQFQFSVDGIGSWEMVALKDEDGDVFAGEEIKPTTLVLTADNYGSITTDGKASNFGWKQYKDFPQLAMGDIEKQMTLTMELNDNGLLTVKQDVDGQVMLFQKASGSEQQQQQAEAPAQQEQVEQAPAVVSVGDEFQQQQQ